MNLDTAKRTISIASLAEQAGYRLSHGGPGEKKLICPNPSHDDTNASCNINIDKNIFRCLGCGAAGSVVDWVMMVEGCSIREAIEKLGVDEMPEEYTKKKQPSKNEQKTSYKPPPAKDVPQSKSKHNYKPEKRYLTKRYPYVDANGNLLYQSIRYDYPDGSKSFILASVNKDGVLNPTMKDVLRIPYKYNEFSLTDTIYFVEGEKCADAVSNILQLPASTICGGSKAWRPEYSEYFRDKTLILIPDNDDTGRSFMQQVASDCAVPCTKVIIADMYNGHEFAAKYDVADACEEHADDIEDYRDKFLLKISDAQEFYKGLKVDGTPSSVLNHKLLERYRQWEGGGLDLKEVFPVLSGYKLRPLVGGDMLVVNAATGAGKTALVQNICHHYQGRPIAWFTPELSESRMHERNLILANEVTGEEIERRMLAGEFFPTDKFDHIHIYDAGIQSPNYVDEQLGLFPLRSGENAWICVFDYGQLAAAPDGMFVTSDTQRINMNAVAFKNLAKKHNVIMIFVSQIGRKEEANLSASKGGGAIEESATVLLGLNYVDGMKDVRSLGVYKNSNGENGFSANIGYEGKYFKFKCDASMRVLQSSIEEARIDEDFGEDNPF